jgi:hypothetical protein
MTPKALLSCGSAMSSATLYIRPTCTILQHSAAVLESRSRSKKTNRKDWRTGGRSCDELVQCECISGSFNSFKTYTNFVDSVDPDGLRLRLVAWHRTWYVGPLYCRSSVSPIWNHSWHIIIVYQLALLRSTISIQENAPACLWGWTAPGTKGEYGMKPYKLNLWH